MSEDTMIKRMDKSAFFDSVTWLNQENWQKFFGKSLPNGILVDHALKLDNTGYRIADMMDLQEGENALTIGNGCLMANGLYAEILTPVTVDNVTEAEKTKLIVVRYDSDNSFASIYQKVDVLTENSITVTNAIRNFTVDESFLCTRNESIYEIPIAFQYYSGGVHTVDLRHFVYAPSGMKRVLNLETVASGTDVKLGVLRGNSYVQLIGGTSYTITIKPTDSEEYFDIYPMVINSNEPITLFIRNGSGEIKKLNLKKMFSNIAVGYEWVDGWTENTHGINISMAIASTMVIRLDVVKQTVDGTTYSVTTKSLGSGGGVDPVTVYTKAEIDNMLAVKANNSDVNQQLAVKENIANLKSLAYKDKVNYETEVANKPTWNSVAKQYFYVDSNNGNDGNSGDQGSPFKTIQKAIDSVNINSVGEIAIASGTYTEKIVIDGKNIILKQKELFEESTGTAFNSKIIIDMYSGRTANEDYIIDITNNSFVKIIGFFTIKGYYHGIQISDNSTVVFTGIVGSSYCKLILELRRRQITLDDTGISICNGSQFITEKNNSVDISDVYRGYFLDKSYCFVYEANFTNIAKYVRARGCYFCYNTSNQQLINTTATENVVQSFDFGTLAYKDDVSNDDKLYVRKNGAWAELVKKIPTNEIENTDIEIYVSTSGNDTTGDGSENKPYRTIQKAVDMAVSGIFTKININNGTYGEAVVVSGKNIFLNASVSNNYVEIDATQSNNELSGTLQITNNSKVIMTDAFRLRGMRPLIINNNSDVYIDNKYGLSFILSSTITGSSNGSALSISNNSKFSSNVENFTIQGDNGYASLVLVTGGSSAYFYSLYNNINTELYANHYDLVSNGSIIIYKIFKRKNIISQPQINTLNNGIVNFNAIIGKNIPEYYVNGSSGDDTNIGNIDYPFKTIGKALDISYGFDEVIIRIQGGSFEYNEKITISKRIVRFYTVDNTLVHINPNTDGSAIDISDHAEVYFIGKFNIKCYTSGIHATNNCYVSIEPRYGTFDITPRKESTYNQYYSQFTFIKISNNCKLYGNGIHLHGDESGYSLSNKNGLVLSSNCFADIASMTFHGDFDNAYNAYPIKVTSSILWYGEINGATHFSKERGGLILTGSNN